MVLWTSNTDGCAAGFIGPAEYGSAQLLTFCNGGRYKWNMTVMSTSVRTSEHIYEQYDTRLGPLTILGRFGSAVFADGLI